MLFYVYKSIPVTLELRVTHTMHRNRYLTFSMFKKQRLLAALRTSLYDNTFLAILN